MDSPLGEHYRTGPGKCACGFDAYRIEGIMLDYGDLLHAHIGKARERERDALRIDRERRQATEALRAEDV